MVPAAAAAATAAKPYAAATQTAAAAAADTVEQGATDLAGSEFLCGIICFFRAAANEEVYASPL